MKYIFQLTDTDYTARVEEGSSIQDVVTETQRILELGKYTASVKIRVTELIPSRGKTGGEIGGGKHIGEISVRDGVAIFLEFHS